MHLEQSRLYKWADFKTEEVTAGWVLGTRQHMQSLLSRLIDKAEVRINGPKSWSGGGTRGETRHLETN